MLLSIESGRVVRPSVAQNYMDLDPTILWFLMITGPSPSAQYQVPLVKACSVVVRRYNEQASSSTAQTPLDCPFEIRVFKLLRKKHSTNYGLPITHDLTEYTVHRQDRGSVQSFVLLDPRHLVPVL